MHLDAEQLWRLALAAVPLAIVIALVGRIARGPATRHALWTTTLLVLVTVPWVPALFRLPALPAPSSAATPVTPVTPGKETADDALVTAAPAIAKPRSSVPPRTPPISQSNAHRPGLTTPATVPSARPTRRSFTPLTSRPAVAERIAPPHREPRDRPDVMVTDAVTDASTDAVTDTDTDTATDAFTATDTVTVTATDTDTDTDTDADAVTAAVTAPAPAPATDAVTVTAPAPATDADTATVPVPVPATVPATATATTASAWVAYAARLRSAAMDVPALPDVFWLLGSAAFALLVGARSMRFARLMTSATHADPEMATIVADAARTLGLRRAPRIRVVDACISPIIWCGLSPLLILPRRLWDELDHAGRVAITYHELAHVKRRDHWTCWLSMAAGCLYWWHPVVWWIRRRVREEADLCCDAWVTMLRPDARRAYATALLETKRYTSVGSTSLPAMALGATTRRARRLARRITMVMTMQNRPGLSVTGAALVGTVALAAWTVVPALACPPEEKEAKTAHAEVHAAAVASGETPPECCQPATGRASVLAFASADARDSEPEQEKSTFERFMEKRGQDASDDDRIAEIEARIAELTARIEEWAARLAEREGAFEAPEMDFEFEMPEMPDVPDMPEAGQWEWHMQAPAVAPRAERRRGTVDDCTRDRARALFRRGGQGGTLYTFSTGDEPAVAFFGGSAGGATVGGSCCNPCSAQCGCGSEQTSQTYRLPEGQLEALTQLMVREDVPVLVTPGEGEITVHGNAAQQRIFGAFVDIISKSEEDSERYAMPDGRLDDFYALMAREDVPVLIAGGEDGIEVLGDATTQRVVGDFIRMVSADGESDAVFWVSEGEPVEWRAGEEQARAMEELRFAYEERARAAQAEMQAVEEQRRELEREYRNHERSAERQRERAERLFDRARDAESEADELMAEADDTEGRTSDRARARAEQLLARAGDLQAQADATGMEADQFEDMAEQIEDMVEQLEDRIEAMMDRLEELADQAAEAAEDHGNTDDDNDDEDDDDDGYRAR